MKSAVSTLHTVTLNDILPHVWTPCFQRCKDILESMVSLQIKLSEVEKYFNKHEFGHNLETQLNNLFKGLNECKANLKGVTVDNLNVAAQLIRQYWNLCQYRHVANIFLNLRDVLNLHGNFYPVERLSSKV